MKLKTLLLAGLVTTAGAALSQAETVYSVNAVGYVNVEIPAGKFMLIGNPVSQATNSLKNILPGAPNGTVVYKFNGASFNNFVKSGANWAPNGNAIFNPGEGFFVKGSTLSNVVLTFVGEVPTGTLNVPVNTGFNLLSSPVPQAGRVSTNLKLPAVAGEVVYRFNSLAGNYNNFVKTGPNTNNWAPSESQFGVGDAFWYSATSSKTWTRDFNINE